MNLEPVGVVEGKAVFEDDELWHKAYPGPAIKVKIFRGTTTGWWTVSDFFPRPWEKLTWVEPD